jgi:hypothetical protein
MSARRHSRAASLRNSSRAASEAAVPGRCVISTVARRPGEVLRGGELAERRRVVTGWSPTGMAAAVLSTPHLTGPDFKIHFLERFAAGQLEVRAVQPNTT